MHRNSNLHSVTNTLTTDIAPLIASENKSAESVEKTAPTSILARLQKHVAPHATETIISSPLNVLRGKPRVVDWGLSDFK
jgi:hypothetical protein